MISNYIGNCRKHSSKFLDEVLPKDYITYMWIERKCVKKTSSRNLRKNYKKDIKCVFFSEGKFVSSNATLFPLFEQMARDRWRSYDFNPQKKYLPPIKSYET